MAEPTIEEFLQSYSPAIRELALAARQFVFSVIPGAIEIVDPPSKIIAYGFGHKYADLICAIAPYTNHVNLIFSHGAELPDPDQLLQGKGKRARHLKIQQVSDLETPGARHLLEEALRRTHN